MSLFRKKRTSAPVIAAFIGGSVVTLAGVAYAAARLLRNRPAAKQDENDFSDTYMPAGMKRGSRRAVHASV
ncbi:MAG: hypothetical protein ABI321_13815 [Polyangia bacterium]